MFKVRAWVKASLLLLFLCFSIYSSQLVHELGHFFMLKLLGYEPLKMVISQGSLLWATTFMDVPVEFRLNLLGSSYVEAPAVLNPYHVVLFGMAGSVLGLYYFLVLFYVLHLFWSGRLGFVSYMVGVHKACFQFIVGLFIPPLGWKFIVNSFEFTDVRIGQMFKPLFRHGRPYASLRICGYLLLAAVMFIVVLGGHMMSLQPFTMNLSLDGAKVYLAVLSIFNESATQMELMALGKRLFVYTFGYVALAWLAQIMYLFKD